MTTSPDRRLWRVLVPLDDRPGSLSAVSAVLAAIGANILSVEVHGLDGQRVIDDLTISCPALIDAELLHDAVRGVGCDEVAVTPAGAERLVDPVVRALAAARRLVTEPDGLPAAAATLLDAAPGAAPEPVTVTERARLRALGELATLLRSGETVLLADGTELSLRATGAADRVAAAAMFARCSLRTTYLRFFSGMVRVPDRVLDGLLAPEEGLGLALLDGGEVRALAQLTGARGDGPPEVAFVVEDAWQGRRLGGLLLRRLLREAAVRGHGTVRAVALPENDGFRRLVRGAVPAATLRYAEGLVQAELPTMPAPARVDAREQSGDWYG